MDYKRAQSIVGTSPGRAENDFYPTPPSATLALLDNYNSWRSDKVWECACGRGDIANVLKDRGFDVVCSDIVDYGYYGTEIVDFTQTNNKLADIVITNPPFRLAEDFIRTCVRLRVQQFAFLAKLALLEGIERTRLLEITPLHRVMVFRKRIKMTRYGLPMKNGGMIAFAWYVWDMKYTGKPEISWI